MIESKSIRLVDPKGYALAELLITPDEDGWFTGNVVRNNFPVEVEKALAWYDKVVRDQMLSYLDEASAAVGKLQLNAQFPDGTTNKIYALHVSAANEVSFRICPVAPPRPEIPHREYCE